MGSSRVGLTSRLRELAGRGRVAGIGVDLVDLARFRRVLDRTPGLVERVFTEGERAYADAKRDPAERYAARFAAKEAVMKAMQVGVFDVPLIDIEISRDDASGAPFVQLHRRAATLAASRGIIGWQLTMTHIDSAAEAVALAFDAPRPGDSGPSDTGERGTGP